MWYLSPERVYKGFRKRYTCGGFCISAAKIYGVYVWIYKFCRYAKTFYMLRDTEAFT